MAVPAAFDGRAVSLWGVVSMLGLGGVTPATKTREFSRSWSWRYYSDGQARKIALGSLRKVDLKDARKLAMRHRARLEVVGIDPAAAHGCAHRGPRPWSQTADRSRPTYR